MIRKKEAWRGTCFPEWGVGGEKGCTVRVKPLPSPHLESTLIRKTEAWRETRLPECGAGAEKDCAKQAEGFENAEFGNSNL